MKSGDGNTSVVGDECHIVAKGKTGPRSGSLPRQNGLDEHENLILLCKIHHKLIDDLPHEYPVERLDSIKQSHEERVERILSLAHEYPSPENEIKRKLGLRQRMREELVVNYQTLGSYPYSKFESPNIIIHSIDDMSYGLDGDMPSNELGYSGWFKLTIWDLYHDGLKAIVAIDYGVLGSEGNWALLAYGQEYNRQKYVKIKMFRLGCVPFQNIVDFDSYCDEYYSCPHFYCKLADNGGPFSEFEWVLFETEEELSAPISNPMDCKRKFELLHIEPP